MATSSVISDEFLRYLMAVGQADVIVGLPTFNNAATVADVVKAVHVSFARDFPRLRTVLVNIDGGSHDGTPEIVRDASPEATDTFTGLNTLRTMHRITSPYHGLPGKGAALRAVFGAADLLQSRAVAVLDPDVISVTPDWIRRLVEPVLSRNFDYVAPVYARPRFDGLLVKQLLRPFFRATYQRALLEPVGGEFACSRAFAVHCGTRTVWDDTFTRWGIDIWLPCEAFASGHRVAQVHLGTRALTTGPSRPALTDVFQQVVGSLFTCLQLHETWWREARPEDVPILGTASAVDEPPAPESVEMALTTAVRDLEPVLARILRPETHVGLMSLAERGPGAFTDELWARTVGEFAAAYHHEVMPKEHLIMALLPLYLGRHDVFIVDHRRDAPDLVERELAALGDAFEGLRSHWIECWDA